jgi:hypothetical protein
VRRRLRSCQITNAENRGTKKPWEKLGSLHHCPTRWAIVGMYSQSSSATMMAAFHHEGRARSVAGVPTIGRSDCSTWLTRSRLCTLGILQHKRSRVAPAIKSLMTGNHLSDSGDREVTEGTTAGSGCFKIPGIRRVQEPWRVPACFATSLKGKELGTIYPLEDSRLGNWLLLVGQILSLLCGKV